MPVNNGTNEKGMRGSTLRAAKLREERLGQRKKMKCGMEAEIIAYRTCTDIDVRFKNGNVRHHTTYDYFKKGRVFPDYKALYTGETRVMNCGMKATVIAYRDYHDIDVRFEDGTVVRHCTYSSYKRNRIGNPNYVKSEFAVHIGEKKMMNCGLEAEITACRGMTKTDIRFSNGALRENISYQKFLNGSLKPLASHVGEKNMMHCGMEAEIIAYRTYKDIDVRFVDGLVREHVAYNDFSTGNLRNPFARVGEKRTMKCGMEAEIIMYRRSVDMDVRFANGTVRKHVAYYDFKRGTLTNRVRKNVKAQGS